MTEFFVVLGVMLLVVTLMSIGVLMGRKPIAGSCGGMKALGMDVACDICGGDKNRCENRRRPFAWARRANGSKAEEGKAADDLATDAMAGSGSSRS